MVGLDGLVFLETRTGLRLDWHWTVSPTIVRPVRPPFQSGMSAFSRFIDFMSNPLFRELFNEYEVHRTSKSLKIVNLARGVSAPFSHPSLEIHAAIDF